MKNKLISKHQNSAGPLTYNKPKLLDEEKESVQFLKNWFTNSNRLEIYNNNVREVIQDDIDRVNGWYDEIINDDYVPETDDLNDAMKTRINRFNMLINNTTARLNKEHKRLHLASLDNTSSQLNKNINSAINIPRYVYGESNSPYQTEMDLHFSNPNIGAYYSPIHNYIAYRPDTVKKTAIHEMTHASLLNASETKIKKIIKDLHEIKPISSYYDNPKEIYARLMLLREHLNIDPNKKWTIEEIQDLQNKQHDTLLDFRLDKYSYPPEILLQFFNDVAHNNSSENTLEPLYAKKGKKLIPKHQTPSQPLVLQNDNTRVSQPVLSVPTTNNIDWIGAANNEIDKIIQSQPHSEIVRHPKRPKSEKEAVTIISDPQKAPQTSSTRVIGLSPVDPIASLFVGLGGFQAPKMLLGIARSPITSGIGLAAGTGGHTIGSAIGETAEKYLGAPELTSDILGLVGGFAGGYKGTSYAMNSPKIQATELPFKSNNLKALNIYGSKRFWHDVKTNPNHMLLARKQGWYPLTIGERRLMIQTLKSKINEGIRYATDRGTTLSMTTDNISINPKITFTGAKTAARRHGEGAFLDDNPTQLSFGAFQNYKTGLTFPLRINTKSLLPNWYLAKKPVSIGAHEAQHEVQKYFLQPLTRYREFIPGAYNRYLHPRLDPDVKRAAADIIKSTGLKGLWEGSLSEMDAELVGWMAENNFPKYWGSLNRGQQTFLANRAADRFGGTPEKFMQLFTEMELAGY